MTTTARHRAADAPTDPVYRVLTPRVTQRVLTAVLVLCVVLLLIESPADSDRIIATTVALVAWIGHGVYLTRRRTAS